MPSRASLRVVIAGGGTGGHLFPGLAVARELLARDAHARVSFAGTAGGIEARVVPRAGFELDLIRSGGLKGKSRAARLRGIALLPFSAVDAWRLISRRAPHVVIGVGGYSSGPVVAVAALRGIPALLLEQNAVPGLANRLLAPLVSSAAVTYEASLAYFRGGKAFVSGNPVRPEFLEIDDAPHDASRRRILIFGGSQGAHAINVAVVEAAPRLAAAEDRLDITCQTGERDLAMVREACRRSGLDARVEPFFEAMDREMSRADLIVCRAGATTLAEITAAGRPAILIPLPTATDDHQRRNAEVLRQAGAADVVDEAVLTGSLLAERIVALAGDPERRAAMAAAARRLARPDAASRIVDRVVELAETRREMDPAAGAARRPAGRSREAVGPVRSATGVLGTARHLHFVGVGGIGMSGIAELLVNLGYVVSGSDLRRSEVTDRLAALGVHVAEGHDARHVGDAEVVVFSSAVRPTNAEIVAARRRGIPVIPRAEMLAELMRLRYGIAVAGAHGKTTTTSMIAVVLEHAGLDPTAVIGGRLSAFGSNARLGQGRYMVAEADESDRSFLRLSPSLAVITNIDQEHMESYGGFADLQQAFVDFANRVPPDGTVVLCADDANVRTLQARIPRRIVTYGLQSPDADVTADEIRFEGFTSTCRVRGRRPPASGRVDLGDLRLAVPGRHNVQNALAAVAVGQELDVPFETTAAALSGFRGVERRFQRRGDVNGITVIDDYGHHPTEIAAVIAAARLLARNRVLVAFQPHRYSRTKHLMDRFGPSLAGADEIVLTGIYAAGEEVIPGVTLDALAEAVRASVAAPVHVREALDQVAPAVARIARPGDLVIILGAGSIGGIWGKVLDELGRAAGR